MNCALRCTVLLSAAGLILCASGCGKKEKPPAEKTSSPAAVKKVTPPKKKVPASPKEKQQDEEEGSLSLKIPVSEQSLPEEKVRISANNLEILDKKDVVTPEAKKRENKKFLEARKSLRTERPKGSLAEELAALNAGKVLRWSPQRVQQGDDVGGVRLPAVCLSPDQSVIAFVEILGEKGGPSLSRIIFMDTHTWTLLSVIHVQKANIRKLCFTKNMLCALTAVPEQNGQHAELLLIHPLNGKVQRKNADDCMNLFVSPSGQIFVTGKNKGTVYHAETIKNKEGTFVTENSNPVLAFSPSGEFFCCVGEKAELFRCSDLKRFATYFLPDGFRCSSAVLRNDRSMYLAPDRLCNMPALFLDSVGKSRNFGTASLGFVIQLPAGEGEIIACMQKKGEIRKFSGITLEPGIPAYPAATRPVTRGVPAAVFLPSHLKGMAVLEESGNFYLLFQIQNSGKWQKEILFSPKKE